MLVHEADTEALDARPEVRAGRKDRKDMTQQDKHAAWRQKFLANLLRAGLEIEEVRHHPCT